MLKGFDFARPSVTILVIVCGLGFQSVAHAAEESVSVRVAAYNVEFGKNASAEEIGEMFKPYDLDIIGFCEAPDGDWTRRVGKVLDMKYEYVGTISSAHHNDKYKTILSRTPLEATQEFRLDGGNWNPASVVRAETTIRGTSIAFMSLHISGSDGKVGHAPNLVKDVLSKENADRFIVVGDFNNRVGERAIDIIQQVGMTITWTDLDLDVAGLNTYNALKPEQKGGVIDHIFYNTASRGKTTGGSIIELKKPLSDHKPVWAEITFPKNPVP
jgi:endonuclease/exonuclease/phosphatase family metal-dependent hydrolase